MDDLKAYYRGSLKNRIETLETVRQALGEDPEARESILRIAHSLRGTGATYGFNEITEAAAGVLAAPAEALPEATEKLIEIMRQVATASPEDAATILIVEDDPGVIQLLEPKLAGPNRRIVTAETSTAATELLQAGDVDLIVLDLMLPDEDGRNLLARLRGNPRYMAIPIIVISAREGSRPKTECYALGADEYFEKPFSLDALSAAVATKLLRAGEISLEARLDPLTGLLNRAGVSIAFERAQALAQRAGYPLSLAVADLDGLKRINDTHGHALGDEVLLRVAKVFTRTLRRSDRVARWGGDEFVVLFPDGKPAGAALAMEKVLRALGQETFGNGGLPLRVGFSAGVTGVGRRSHLDQVVAEADRLLYRAKEAGGHRVLTSDRRPQALKKRVLLTESDAATAALIEEHFSAAKLDVAHCSDGESALARALAGDVDLAIFDLATPGISGFELLEHLRQTAVHAETPIILLAAEDDEEELLRAFDLGADDYLVKPFSPLELRARASRLLKTLTRRGG